MKSSYISPLVSIEDIIEEIEILKASWEPNTKEENAAPDSGHETGGSPTFGGDGDGGDMAKGGTFIWDDEF